MAVASLGPPEVSARPKRATTPTRRNCRPVIGDAWLHTAIDDHSRLADTEILADERQETAAAPLAPCPRLVCRARVRVQRVMTDNGSCSKSRLWHYTVAQTGAVHKRTRAYRPQTNGKVERFHHTLASEWAYAFSRHLRHRTCRQSRKATPGPRARCWNCSRCLK
jgi:transposase InsO family protein